MVNSKFPPYRSHFIFFSKTAPFISMQKNPTREISSLLRQLQNVITFFPTANVLLCIKFKSESLSRWPIKFLFSL